MTSVNPPSTHKNLRLLAGLITIVLGSGTTHASWEWTPFGPVGGSSAFSITAAPVAPLVNVTGTWFDRPHAPVNVLVMTDGEPVTVTTGTPSFFGDRHWDFDFDSDDDGIFPGMLMIDINHTYAITDRGVNGGGLGALPQAIDNQYDLALQTWDAFGSPIDHSSGIAWHVNNGGPGSFTSGGTVAQWDNLNGTGFAGITNGGLSATTFPHTPNPTIAGSISRQKLTFSDFRNTGPDTTFRLSFDGGLPLNALRVPEPSRAVLLALGFASGILGRRRRA